MLFFRSKEHTIRWCNSRNHQPGEIISLEKAWELAKAWFGEILDPDYQRKTLTETREVFNTLGLTSSFWALEDFH
ncbi:MAG: hypothetical protein FVQ83_02935 [Chloroflexi bacterium]|nr:hypothetical protein [Chloroflexota bacterium]